MYNIPYFKETDQHVVVDFMRQHPFAMLIGCTDNRPVATQVPLLLEEKNDKILLAGHIMKDTDHHKAFLKNNNALCVFTGAHTYVSASWYTQPQRASTWNYMSVHARGRIRFLDEAALQQILEKTTALFENNPSSPALFHHLPKAYVNDLLNAIVAFEIEVEELNNVFKLSQNRDKETYENIIRKLNEGRDDQRVIAEEMQKRKEELFKQEK